MLSSIDTIEPIGTCKRWSKTLNQQIDVRRPAIVQAYNENMGGVDLFGVLIALYRVGRRSKRGYLRIVYWAFNVAVVNGWQLYRRNVRQLQVPQKYYLVDFQTYIARALCTIGADDRKKAGRPRLHTPPITPKRGPKRMLPIPETRFDTFNHWPIPNPNKSRCAHCKKGQSRITCNKCKINLCLTNAKNCFLIFHTGQQVQNDDETLESDDENLDHGSGDNNMP